MATPEQPAKKRRSIRPYLATLTGKVNLALLLVGCGCFLWTPVEVRFFSTTIKDPGLAVFIALGIGAVAVSVSNLRRNMTIKR